MTRGNRLVHVSLDESLAAASQVAAQDRETVITDLLEDNAFSLKNGMAGPYRLTLSTMGNRLIFDVRSRAKKPLLAIGLSLTPFRGIIREYFQICGAYDEAIRTGTPQQIETIDMARRGLHNEGSNILRERLEDKVTLDLETARRLFTLVCALVQREPQ